MPLHIEVAVLEYLVIIMLNYSLFNAFKIESLSVVHMQAKSKS